MTLILQIIHHQSDHILLILGNEEFLLFQNFSILVLGLMFHYLSLTFNIP